MKLNEAFKILNLKKGASEEEINKAYKKNLSKYHPDKFINEDEKKEAEKKFKEIQQAHELVKNNPFGIAEGTRFSFSFSTDGNKFRSNPEGDPVTFNDLFNLSRKARFIRSSNLNDNFTTHTLKISFEEAALGCVKEIEIKDKHKCSKCDGKAKENCSCKNGVETIVKKYQIKINPGTKNKDKLTLVGDLLNNSKNIIEIHVESDPDMSLTENGDVFSTIEISLLDALKGTSIKVKTLKGNKLLKIPSKIKHKQILKMKGLGILDINKGMCTDHLFEVSISYPENVEPIIEVLEKE